MQIEFVGGAGTVTGSSYLLKDRDFTIMIDCGMFQGREELKRRNSLNLIYSPEQIDMLLLTHAHIDHSGLIPKLVKEGFKGRIYATKATTDLCGIMLPDSAHVQEVDVKWVNRKNKKLDRPLEKPLYSADDAEKALDQFVPVSYGETVHIHPRIKVRFRDAGHILGSAFIEMWVEDNGKTKKIVFSGDLGTKGQAIIRDPEIIDDANYLLIESTYGDRLHKSKEDTYTEFKNIINQSVHTSGNIIVPAFAIERTQEIIFTLGKMMSAGDIPPFPVYIDSPLAISATEIFRRNPECFDRETLTMLTFGQSPLDFDTLKFVQTTEESKALNKTAKGSMIIAASGMCTAGRIKFHLQENLYNPNSSVIFVGYQAEGTLGRRLVDGADRIKLYGEDVIVRAKIYTLGGFSAHADRKGLQEWVGAISNPDLKVFVVHGEPNASQSFAKLLRDSFHINAYIPRWGEIVDLDTMESKMASYGAVQPVEQSRFESDINELIASLERFKSKLNTKRKTKSMIDNQNIKENIQDIRAMISSMGDSL